MNTRKSPMLSLRLVLVLIIISSALLSTLHKSSSTVSASSTKVVISQIYGGGGTEDRTKIDYVELFNAGDVAVSLDGWSIQYASATGTGNFGGTDAYLTPLSGSLGAGKYLLVKEAVGSQATDTLEADLTDPTPIEINALRGKIVLADQATSLGCNGSPTTCSSAVRAHILDLLGYGVSTTYYEGTAPASDGSNGTALFRISGGCIDNDQNSADFKVNTPAPRNGQVSAISCPMQASASLLPSQASFDVDRILSVAVIPGSNPTSQNITVSADLSAVGGLEDQPLFDDGTHSDETAGDLSFSYQIQIPQTVAAGDIQIPLTVQDAQSRTETLSVTLTISLPTYSIHSIQGNGHVSPYVGEQVLTTGIVTGIRSNGFYLQTPEPDEDIATSEGIFVYTAQPPVVFVGDEIQVSGWVSEYRSDESSLSVTEIVSPTIQVQSHAKPLPPAIILGVGGRIPPNRLFTTTSGEIDTISEFNPVESAIDFYESLEGMRVQINQARVVGPNDANGIVAVLGDGNTSGLRLTARGGLPISSEDFNPERIFFDEAILKKLSSPQSLPNTGVGDLFSSSTIGIMDYSNTRYLLQVTELAPLVKGSLTREITSPAVAHQLMIATFNANNLSAADSDSRFQKLAQQIVENLQSPDILVIEEIQDNNGAVDNNNVDANETCDKLIRAIQITGGPLYTFKQINPENNQDGGQPGANIRSVFFYRTDRGLDFSTGNSGNSVTANSVQVDANGHAHIRLNPGLIEPNSPAFQDSRKPIAAEFTFNGQSMIVVASHLRSKLSDQPLFGRYQPPLFTSETSRIQQAAAIHSFIKQIVDLDSHANIVVLGDLNDFEFSTSLSTLKGTPALLYNLTDTLPVSERYTYIYQGNSEMLDHILVSQDLFKRFISLDVVHINSEFAQPLSDHDPQAARFDFNHSPHANASVQEIQLISGQSFQFQLPANLFTDPDETDQLQYTASLANGAALPNWLHFDAETQTFSGTCHAMNEPLEIQVMALDSSGSSASIVFRLTPQESYLIHLPLLLR